MKLSVLKINIANIPRKVLLKFSVENEGHYSQLGAITERD